MVSLVSPIPRKDAEAAPDYLYNELRPPPPALAPAARQARPRAGRSLPLSPGCVALHCFRLDLAQPEFRICRAVLDPEELRRAERFAREELRRKWVVARGTLRILLGRYLGTDPAALAFSNGPFGKPALAGEFGLAGLEFNLSHSDGIGALALAWAMPVGVDVESVRPLDDFDTLVSRFFSRREATAFAQLAPAQKEAAFFNLWTRKEAWLKATGLGIGEYLNLVEVSFLPGAPARLLGLPRRLTGGAQWKLAVFDPGAGYAGAVVAGTAKFELQFYAWDHEPRI